MSGLLRNLLLAAACLLPAVPAARALDGQTGLWGDQGDGTFRNPVLSGDFSDPDPIRVGDDYYMVSSTFAGSPGIPVLHSKDLVNWKPIGAVIPDLTVLGPEFSWNRMNRYGVGIYAPTIRFHDGKFRVFVNCYSGEGFFCCTATNPAGPWTVTQIRDKHGKPLRTHAWTDPCPFWDDDGKAYLASSRPGREWFSYLFEMSPDGTQLLDADVDKMNVPDVKYAYPDGGTLFSPFQSSEGNRIFKRNGYYYLIHIEFLDAGQGKGTYVLRSKNLFGTKPDGSPGKPGDPGTYEIHRFGPVGPGFYGQEIPGQGGLVDTPDGRWFWLAQFNQLVSDGRTSHLLPVTWIDDWPVPGVDIKDRQGKFAWQLPKPVPGHPVVFPFGGDTFESAVLHPQWQWNHQPRAEKWSLTERPGFLRLHAFPPLVPGKFSKAGNTVCQRHFRSDLTRAVARLDLAGMADGQEAGLAHFNGGSNHATLAVRNKAGKLLLKFEEDGRILWGPELPEKTASLWIGSTVGADEICRFDYSLDGKTFVPFGGAYQLKPGGYRGDMVGLYSFNDLGESGFVDVDSFEYHTRNAPR